MSKTLLLGLIVSLMPLAATASEVFTGGVALEKTAQLAKQSIPLNDGNPEPVLALAARHGKALGHFSGKAAEAVRKTYGKPIPIYVIAEKTGAVSGQPGCSKIQLTYKTSPEYASSSPEQKIDVAVCPKR